MNPPMEDRSAGGEMCDQGTGELGNLVFGKVEILKHAEAF
jgi:hypothetical protein